MHYCDNATIDDMQTVSRLNQQFKPNNYKIFLDIDRINRKFNGSVTIFGKTFSDNHTIILHSKDLDIKNVVVDGKTADFSIGINDELTITHPDIIPAEHVIVISYTGIITDSMHGMYPCYYEHKGIKKELIATQFESHHAREVIPCVDEPAAKATFDLTISTENNQIVLGNMPIKSQDTENDKLVTVFNTTPIMSSYLLAWVVGELHKKTAFTKSGVEVNIWATPAQPAKSLDFALDIATRSIDFFDQYFDTPYPLPKADHVALPDFSSGAMENWGLITYREIALLADPKNTSISNKRYIATVIAHELSHQWFGNLVTMEWWNDLWLNESFASLVEYIAVDALEPSWNIWLDFASYESIAALKRDSLDGVQPVQIDINHPDEINTLFDGAIVYAKGARLLQALRYYIGESAFQSGLKHYFKKHAYKNTVSNDLWKSFNTVCDKDIESFMQKWLSQPGFPVVHVRQDNEKIYLSQNRLTNVYSDKDTSNQIWPIVLNAKNDQIPELLDKPKIEFEYKSDKIPKLNNGSIVHFITNYDQSILNRMINELNDKKLPAIDRLQILNEQSILASAGIVNNASLVKLIEAYADEDTESVWDIIGFSIGELKKFVSDDDEADSNLRTLVGIVAKKQYDRLGWDKINGENESDTSLRSTIISMMLYSEHLSVISTAINKFNACAIENLDPELRGAIMSAAVIYENNPDTIDKLVDSYKNTDSSELKQSISAALTSTRDKKVIDQILSIVKDSSIIRTQDVARWIVNLLRNKHAKDESWKWIQENWDWITKTFSGDKSYDDYPKYAANFLSTEKQLIEYQKLFNPLIKDPSLTRAIEMGINEISNRIKLIKRDKESVKEALSKF